jgi:hypothetical protein
MAMGPFCLCQRGEEKWLKILPVMRAMKILNKWKLKTECYQKMSFLFLFFEILLLTKGIWSAMPSDLICGICNNEINNIRKSENKS